MLVSCLPARRELALAAADRSHGLQASSLDSLHNSVFTYTTCNVLGLCKRFGTLHFIDLAHRCVHLLCFLPVLLPSHHFLGSVLRLYSWSFNTFGVFWQCTPQTITPGPSYDHAQAPPALGASAS